MNMKTKDDFFAVWRQVLRLYLRYSGRGSGVAGERMPAKAYKRRHTLGSLRALSGD
jgi:hypothetical protein